MNPHSLPSSKQKRIHQSSVELFHIRLTTKLCMAIVCMLQLIARLLSIIGKTSPMTQAVKLRLLSIPFSPIISIIIGLEYFLFKKKGPGILKYSQIIDIVLLLLFMGDWIGLMISSLVEVSNKDPPCFSISALYGFTSFSWKTLLVTLIVQQWQLKIIAPIVATCVATGYAIYYDPNHIYFILLRTATQVFNIIFIIYCEDKLKWKIIWVNLQQEKWMQVNNFILNNIPENIMILDFKGEAKFISDYCKSFMEGCNLPLDAKVLLSKIQHLQQAQSEVVTVPNPSTVIQIERLASENELIAEMPCNSKNNTNTLEEILLEFKNIIVEKGIQERQFLVYNGKLEMENQKSLEIKISFIQHFESEYIILILRDTTQRDLLITLEETNKYKDQLLASVSHELRAPLNGNISLVETAANSPKIPDHIKESLLVPALRSSQFLLHIINDILDMSQIKEKKLRLSFESSCLKETLKSTAQLVELQAQKKGIELILDLDPNLPDQFCTDHIRLSQIVLNLLNNAIKFTKEGTVKLSAIYLPQKSWVKINIEDSGIGMSEENLQKLFLSYTHIEFEGRHIMNPTGVGLGLNIAYNLAELLAPASQKGITVTSAENQGSVFSFVIENKAKALIHLEDNSDDSRQIPCEIPGDIQPILFSKLKTHDTSSSLASEEPADILFEIPACSCPKILIVDDNPFNTMALETILGSLDIKCDSVYSGSCAIEKLLERENKRCSKDCKAFSVVFMDQEMPGMSGDEAVKEIRKLQKERLLRENIKIIGCTAHKSKEEVERFEEAGLDKCIQKPISVMMIKDILGKFKVS